MFRTLLVAALAAMLASCGKVVWVHVDEDPQTVKEAYGIPFFVKKEQFRKTSVYAETWLRATLTVAQKVVDTKGGNEKLIDGGAAQYVRNLPKPPSPELLAIKTDILHAGRADHAVALKTIAAFQKLTEINPKQICCRVVLLKNVVESEWVVDSSRTYYLNAPLPWLGSGNLTQKLNPDGTLSEAISAPDTKVAEGIGSLIPFKEYLTGEYVKPATAPEDPAEKTTFVRAAGEQRRENPQTRKADQQYVYVLSLSIEEIGHEYTLTSPPQNDRPDVAPPLLCSGIEKHDVQFSRRTIGPSENLDKKEGGATVGITGSIEFPEGWGAPKPEESAKK